MPSPLAAKQATATWTRTSSPAKPRFNLNFPAVHLDDALGYGEPQASAAFPGDGIVSLLELVKQRRGKPRDRGNG
jgi:hypothetical protein